MNENVTTILSNRFTYHAPTKIFVAEASDMRERLTDGFWIVSSKTGKKVFFSYVGNLRENEDYDGELSGWEFESYDGYKVHLYND